MHLDSFAPGTVLRHIQMPELVANVTFGDPDHKTLHIAAAPMIARPLDFAETTCNVAPFNGCWRMFDSFRKFLSEVSEGGEHPIHFDHDDYRLAAAALLVHAAAIDGDISDVERDNLHTIIKRQFGLDEATTDELVTEATEAEHEAIDLYHFTQLINRSLEEDGRRRVVEMMWEMVYADGHVSEFERNLIWRAADLLGVSSRERIELGQQVAIRQGTG